jgi:fructokinase
VTALRLGIDLGGTKIHAVVLDASGQVCWEARRPTPRDDYDATLDALADVVGTARAALGGSPVSVGIGGPGTLTAEGLLKNANSTWLNGRPIERDLAVRLGQPVRYANDANCLALSEATDGAGAGARVVFAVILGTGTGAGIAVDGKVLVGPNGVAGEWGHNPLPWLDPAEDPVFDCYCGRQGCNETLLSGTGLAREHAWRHGGELRGEEIVERAAAGHAACQATRVRHARRYHHGKFARAAAERNAVQLSIFRDDRSAHCIDIARRGPSARPQMQRSKRKQASARADIGKIAHRQPLRLHVREHGKASRGGLVVPGAEGLTGRDHKVLEPLDRGMIGGAHIKGALADRLHAFLSQRDPVGIGKFLNAKLRRSASEQRGNGCLVRRVGFPFQPHFKLPVAWRCPDDLAAAEHDGNVPIFGILMRNKGSADHIGRRQNSYFPTHFRLSAASFARLALSLLRPAAA